MGNEKQAILAERIFDGRHWHDNTAILIDGGRIHALAASGDVPSEFPTRCLSAGTFVAPGFIDLQVNGGGGILLNDDPSAETMCAIALAHRQLGTTAILPTLITDSVDTMNRAIASALKAAGRHGVLGLHLEGPFINPARGGVHAQQHITCAEMRYLELLRGLGKAGRSLITLAPECVPSGFIAALVRAGTRVSAGHSEASAEAMQRAIEEGLTGITHLYNAMPPLQGRAPGVIGSAFADSRLVAGLIVDGLHVHPVCVRAAFVAKGADNIMLVTDAMPTVGGDVDSFELTGQKITLQNGRLLTDGGTLGGAHLDMVAAVRNAVKLCGIPLDDALQAATLTPARFLGLERERGALVPGARADLVALSPDLHLRACWVDAMEVSCSSS